jgi:hypothetical protein
MSLKKPIAVVLGFSLLVLHSLSSTDVVPMPLSKSATTMMFVAEKSANARLIPLAECEIQARGVALGYKPRPATTAFTVGVDAASQATEPLLSLECTDHQPRSVFISRFGESTGDKLFFECEECADQQFFCFKPMNFCRSVTIKRSAEQTGHAPETG